MRLSRTRRNACPGRQVDRVRTLDLFEEAGCVSRVASAIPSCITMRDEGHHHHLVCRKCGKSVECAEDLFAPLEQSLAGTTASTSTSPRGHKRTLRSLRQET